MCCVACAQCCCLCTLCISQCVASWQMASYAIKLGEAVKASKESADIKTAIELHVIPQPCLSESKWVDSKGAELTMGDDPMGIQAAAGMPREQGGAPQPLAGPPYGYNLVITMETNYDVNKWPPGGNQPPTVPPPAAAAEVTEAPTAPTEGGENNV